MYEVPGFLGILRGKNLRKLNPDPNISREYVASTNPVVSLSPCVYVHLWRKLPSVPFPEKLSVQRENVVCAGARETIIKLENAFFFANFKFARLRVLSERSQNRQVNDSKVRNWLPRVLLKLEGHVLHGFTLIADLVFVRFREFYTTH